MEHFPQFLLKIRDGLFLTSRTEDPELFFTTTGRRSPFPGRQLFLSRGISRTTLLSSRSQGWPHAVHCCQGLFISEMSSIPSRSFLKSLTCHPFTHLYACIKGLSEWMVRDGIISLFWRKKKAAESTRGANRMWSSLRFGYILGSLGKMNFVTLPTAVLCSAEFSVDGGFCIAAAWEPRCRVTEGTGSGNETHWHSCVGQRYNYVTFWGGCASPRANTRICLAQKMLFRSPLIYHLVLWHHDFVSL